MYKSYKLILTNYWYISVTNTLALQIKKNTSELYSFWPTVNKLYLPMIHIRGHKGQNSTETRCRGFLVLESRCCGFSVLESRCRGLSSSEKMPWNHDVVGQLSPFLVSWFFGLGISMSRGFLVLESRCRGICVSTASFSFSLNQCRIVNLCKLFCLS